MVSVMVLTAAETPKEPVNRSPELSVPLELKAIANPPASAVICDSSLASRVMAPPAKMLALAAMP